MMEAWIRVDGTDSKTRKGASGSERAASPTNIIPSLALPVSGRAGQSIRRNGRAGSDDRPSVTTATGAIDRYTNIYLLYHLTVHTHPHTNTFSTCWFCEIWSSHLNIDEILHIPPSAHWTLTLALALLPCNRNTWPDPRFVRLLGQILRDFSNENHRDVVAKINWWINTRLLSSREDVIMNHLISYTLGWFIFPLILRILTPLWNEFPNV